MKLSKIVFLSFLVIPSLFSHEYLISMLIGSFAWGLYHFVFPLSNQNKRIFAFLTLFFMFVGVIVVPMPDIDKNFINVFGLFIIAFIPGGAFLALIFKTIGFDPNRKGASNGQ